MNCPNIAISEVCESRQPLQYMFNMHNTQDNIIIFLFCYKKKGAEDVTSILRHFRNKGGFFGTPLQVKIKIGQNFMYCTL